MDFDNLLFTLQRYVHHLLVWVLGIGISLLIITEVTTGLVQFPS